MVVVRNGGVSVRIKKSSYLVLSPNSVFRESGCLSKLIIHVTPAHLRVILTHVASIKLYLDLALDLSVP